jgi:hypothetical protein
VTAAYTQYRAAYAAAKRAIDDARLTHVPAQYLDWAGEHLADVRRLLDMWNGVTARDGVMPAVDTALKNVYAVLRYGDDAFYEQHKKESDEHRLLGDPHPRGPEDRGGHRAELAPAPGGVGPRVQGTVQDVGGGQARESLTLDQALDDVQVDEPGTWSETGTVVDWYAVSTGKDGAVAYFANERDACRYRLDLINRKLNG